MLQRICGKEVRSIFHFLLAPAALKVIQKKNTVYFLIVNSKLNNKRCYSLFFVSSTIFFRFRYLPIEIP